MSITTKGIRGALEEALVAAAVKLTGDSAAVPELELARAKNAEHGDFASPAGMKLARVLRKPPPEIARELVETMTIPDSLATVEPLGGYVNFRLSPEWLQSLVGDVAVAGPSYGSSDLGVGEKVQVEFVSVNPTGPLHVGHGRGAILGDVLSRLLAFTGHTVHREYYVNDFGSQTLKFGQSIIARMEDREPPEGGYVGDYVRELAERAQRDLPGMRELPDAEKLATVQLWATAETVAALQESLARLRVQFDEWFSETRLWSESGAAPRAIEELERSGHLVVREGARWFDVSTFSPSEEDRVVVRGDSQPTYFASDLGYLLNRFRDRDFQRVIEVWGADHYGYVARMKAAAQAFGIDPERLQIILVQIVKLKGGRMSKREGRLVTLDELVETVGVDAVRYFYLLRSPEAQMEFDLDLAVSESNENPVYYAQYAHARLANVEKVASERPLPPEADLSLLREPWELDLARQIAFWPDAIAEAARLLEPHRIPYFVHDLADRVHGFYQAGNRDWRHRVVVDDAHLTRARLELCRAARNALRAALDLMGVSAPERM